MKILLLGDMSPTENNFDLFDKADTDKLFGDAASIFKGNDFNLINLDVFWENSRVRLSSMENPASRIVSTIFDRKRLSGIPRR